MALNLFLPVIVGISIADRLVRDEQLGVSELFRSTPLSRLTYLMGKYAGSLLVGLTPVFLILILGDIAIVARGGPLVFVPISLVTALAINVPAFAFITAFSLACPMFMPVRVYQVLFTGYWFWGNYLNPQAFPTLAGTIITPRGEFAYNGFFGGFPGSEAYIDPNAGLLAVANILVLGVCVMVAMVAVERFLSWKSSRA